MAYKPMWDWMDKHEGKEEGSSFRHMQEERKRQGYEKVLGHTHRIGSRPHKRAIQARESYRKSLAGEGLELYEEKGRGGFGIKTKHPQVADMLRAEGEKAAMKSQRRNVFRELNNLGKHADEERKKEELDYREIHKKPLRHFVAQAHKKMSDEEAEARGMQRWESWAEDHPEEAEKMMEEGR